MAGLEMTTEVRRAECTVQSAVPYAKCEVPRAMLGVKCRVRAVLGASIYTQRPPRAALRTRHVHVALSTKRVAHARCT